MSVMEPAKFWLLIEMAARGARDGEQFVTRVQQALALLPRADIIAFRHRFDQFDAMAETWPLWAAAYVMNGGCGDDGFVYWRAWLIAQGREVYDRAIAEPQSLADARLRFVDEGGAELESFIYAAGDALEASTGENIHKVLKADPPYGDPAFTARGLRDEERWDESTVHLLMPKIAAKFGYPG